MSDKASILFISGSPRAKSSVALMEVLVDGAHKAGAVTQSFMLSNKHILPCVGCEQCSKTGNCSFANKTHNGRFVDDYLELKGLLERVDALAIVAPVYFAGPPAQLKALLDRMQPYWAQHYVLGYPAPKKRPVQLFVLGTGEDSHGFAPLAGSVKSSMAVAGFNLEKVNNFIGYKSADELPQMPSLDAATDMHPTKLAKIRRILTSQESLTQRAQDAGGAFARSVIKRKIELEQITNAGQSNLVQESMQRRKVDDTTHLDDEERRAHHARTRAKVTLEAGAPTDKDSRDTITADIDSRYSSLLSIRGLSSSKNDSPGGIDSATADVDLNEVANSIKDARQNTAGELDADLDKTLNTDLTNNLGTQPGAGATARKGSNGDN